MKQRPAWLKALGKKEFPDSLTVGPDSYLLVKVFKHDFWAATALYAGEAGKIVVKVHRQASVLGFPMRWTGRLMAGHECRLFELLQDLEGVPRLLGRHDGTGLIHEYIEGQAHRRGGAVDAAFVDRLRQLLAEIHRRDAAYVDLEKPDNVLVGEDGRPYLFDFQISFHWPRRWGGATWPGRWLLHRLQYADRYHFVKMIRRTNEELLTEEERAGFQRPALIRLFNALWRPIKVTRRRLLSRLDPHRKRERQP